MFKPIEEWYELLSEPERSEALEARRKAEKRRPDMYWKGERAKSLAGAIQYGFSWEKDGGDCDKWEAIHDRAAAGEFDHKPAAPIDLDSSVATITAMRERIAELEAENKAMAEKINAMSKILNQ